MSDLTEKKYGSVDCVHFDRHGNGPLVTEVDVRANAHPNLNYPRARIYLGAWGEDAGESDFGGNTFTVPDAIRLVRMLKAAIADVVRHCPSLAVEQLEDDLAEGDEDPLHDVDGALRS